MNRCRAMWALLLVPGLVGCPSGSHQVREAGQSPVVQEEAPERPISIEKLLSAPTELKLGEISIRLETYLWRDFQPVSPPQGQPLRVVVKLIAQPEPSVPLGQIVQPVRVYLVYRDNLTWEADLAPSATAGQKKNVVEAYAQQGPLWEPGSAVEVVVKVRDGEGNTYLLRAPEQVIHKTY